MAEIPRQSALAAKRPRILPVSRKANRTHQVSFTNYIQPSAQSSDAKLSRSASLKGRGLQSYLGSKLPFSGSAIGRTSPCDNFTYGVQIRSSRHSSRSLVCATDHTLPRECPLQHTYGRQFLSSALRALLRSQSTKDAQDTSILRPLLRLWSESVNFCPFTHTVGLLSMLEGPQDNIGCRPFHVPVCRSYICIS